MTKRKCDISQQQKHKIKYENLTLIKQGGDVLFHIPQNKLALFTLYFNSDFIHFFYFHVEVIKCRRRRHSLCS